MNSEQIRSKIDKLFERIDDIQFEIDRLIEQLEEKGEEYQ